MKFINFSEEVGELAKAMHKATLGDWEEWRRGWKKMGKKK